MTSLLSAAIGLAVLAFGVSSVSAQSYRHRIGVSVGTFGLRALDQQASPLLYVARIRPLYGLTYHHQAARSQFALRLAGGLGTMNPDRFGPRTYSTTLSDGTPFVYQISSQLYHLNLEADYLRRIVGHERHHFTAWVGGSIGEAMLYSDEVANFPWVVNATTFSPTVLTTYTIGAGHRLMARADVAVAGLITRAIWANFPKSTGDNNVVAYFKQGTHPATVDKLGNVNLQLGYSHQLSPRLRLAATYRARYLTYSDPRPIRTLISSLSLQGEVHF